MGQQQSRPHQRQGRGRHDGAQVSAGDWWDALRLGLVTVAVGAVQLLRYHLTIEDGQRRHDGRESRRHANHRPGAASTLSPETRRALVELIDYQVTPLLVDQWRLGLVKVMLDPEEGPMLPDSDPHMRQAVLTSLKEAEAARARQQHRPSPAPAAPQPHRSSAGASQRPAATPAASSSAGPSGSAVLSEHRPPAAAAADTRPSAPPLSVPQPSAPPLTASPAAGPGARADSGGPDPDGCGICMDAPVEVQIDGCRHRMCCECAKAICCLQGRAPQCPFCRGPMTSVSAIPPA